MHENLRLEDEFERQERRLDDRIFQPPTVNTLSDIKRLLAELDPSRDIKQTVPLSSEMVAEDVDGNLVRYALNAKTEAQNKRSIVISGFEFIKSRAVLEDRAKNEVMPVMINGRPMSPAIRPAVAGHAWIDPLIKRWFNANREGLRMVWVIKEGKFLYDPFTNKLYRSKQTSEEAAKG